MVSDAQRLRECHKQLTIVLNNQDGPRTVELLDDVLTDVTVLEDRIATPDDE